MKKILILLFIIYCSILNAQVITLDDTARAAYHGDRIALHIHKINTTKQIKYCFQINQYDNMFWIILKSKIEKNEQYYFKINNSWLNYDKGNNLSGAIYQCTYRNENFTIEYHPRKSIVEIKGDGITTEFYIKRYAVNK